MQFINGPTRGRGAIPGQNNQEQEQQQLQEYLDQAENDLYNNNIDGAISALQKAEQIANQLGNLDDRQLAKTISQAIQILNNIKPQLYNAVSIIQQEQNNSSYTQNDLQSIQNAINELNNVKNSVDKNPFTTPLSNYVNHLLSTAQKIESNIQNYLQQQQQQQLQNYITQAESDLQNGNISDALSALQNAEQIANQIGDTRDANTISQAIQILSSIQQQLNNVVNTIQQEQNNSSYTQNDLQEIQNAINTLNNISNSIGNNQITSYLSSYVNNLLSTAQQIESNIQSYLQQQQQQQLQNYITSFSAPTQTTQPQVSINTQNLTINLQNALQSGNLNEALQILNQLESSTNNTAEINQAIDTINQVKNLLQELNTALIQGQNPQFVVDQLSALVNTTNPYLNGLSTYINNIVSGFSPNNSSQEVQVQYNQTVANYLLNNDYADAIAAAPQYASYIIALAQEPGSTITMKMNGLLESFYYYAAKAYEALKNGDRNAAIQYKEKAKYYQNIINALSTITGQNFTQNATYDAAVNALNAVINVVGDAAIAAAPSILSSGTETQRAQIQLL
ncbi:MAG: hypothetical protein QW046_04870 [Candidatus Micrarchaeaceae archaeon]|uniref:hypothetical protein n=1 Tax=Metallosphaera sp. TaxID=2020860 RepID=UPI003166F4C0